MSTYIVCAHVKTRKKKQLPYFWIRIIKSEIFALHCIALHCIALHIYKIKILNDSVQSVCKVHILSCTDYGLPMKPFFIEIPNFWAWADIFWGVLGIFQFISTYFGTVSPLSMLFINQTFFFLQKTRPLYPNPKYLLGI